MNDNNVKVLTSNDVISIVNDKLERQFTQKQKNKLNKLYNKHKIKNKLIIERVARKTVRYIEKNTSNFPKNYKVLKDKIISSCYLLLESIIRANVYQEVIYKKEVVVQIQMLNFYLEESLNKGLLTEKKFISYTNHLIEIDKMVRSWITSETKN